MKWSTETIYQIWNDDTGEHYEVGHDADGLGLVEIRSYSDDEKPGSTVTFGKEVLPFLIQALEKMLPV